MSRCSVDVSINKSCLLILLSWLSVVEGGVINHKIRIWYQYDASNLFHLYYITCLSFFSCAGLRRSVFFFSYLFSVSFFLQRRQAGECPDRPHGTHQTGRLRLSSPAYDQQDGNATLHSSLSQSALPASKRNT